jgi:hypothetical protein
VEGYLRLVLCLPFQPGSVKGGKFKSCSGSCMQMQHAAERATLLQVGKDSASSISQMPDKGRDGGSTEQEQGSIG